MPCHAMPCYAMPCRAMPCGRPGDSEGQESGGLTRSPPVSIPGAPATGANCSKVIKSQRGLAINGPFSFQRRTTAWAPRLSQLPRQKKGWVEAGGQGVP